MIVTVLPGVASAEDPGGSSIAECYTDRTDDQGDSRANITRHCVGYQQSLSLYLEVAQPTDPRTSENWQGATSIVWWIDTDNDGEGEFAVTYHLNTDGVLTADVRDNRGTTDVTVCTAAPAYTGAYHASDIPRSCIGNPASIRVSPAVNFDADPNANPNPPSDIRFDSAPGGSGFEAPASRIFRTSGRHAGATRIETAIAISQARFPSGTVPTVYIAESTLLIDAIAGGVLTDGPILLVPRCGAAPSSVLQEVNRLNPNAVVALGGSAAVCDQMLSAVAQGRPTARAAGQTRIETSIAISQRRFPGGGGGSLAPVVYIARADVFADAVAGGALTDGPILLVPTCGSVPSVVRDEINRIAPGAVIALGGEAAVCSAMLTGVAGGRPTSRLAGATRFETAIAISQRAFPGTAATTYIARSDVFADAVAGGILTDGPVLLVAQCGGIKDTVDDEISRLASSRVIALGGGAAVCDANLLAARDA